MANHEVESGEMPGFGHRILSSIRHYSFVVRPCQPWVMVVVAVGV